MLPLKKSITSKSVILLIIFLSSTTFGFLEKTNRGYESQRSFRDRRVSKDRDLTEEMPFRRDTSRRANEKDIIYENLYDRRSFRTGTDRHIRNQDRERISKIQDRNLEERSTFSNPANRNRQQSYRLLDNRSRLDRSRSFTQNDRTSERRTGIDMNTRNIREQRERNVDIRHRVLDERRIRESTERELRNREDVSIRSKYLSRDNNRERERNVDNKNEFVSRRNEATQNLRLDRNRRAIPTRSFGDERYAQHEINFRCNSQIREDREANFKNTERRYRDYRRDDARQQVEQQSRRSLSRFSRSVETPVNHERSLEKRERRFLGNDRENNRRQNERFEDKRTRSMVVERQESRVIQDTRGSRSVHFDRESRETLPMAIRDVQNVREFRSREQRNRENFNRSSRKYRNDNINERGNRESRESRMRDQRNRNPSTDRFSRVIRDDSSRFVLGTSENRYRNERSLAGDRAVPNRGLTSRNDVYRAGLSRSDSARRILDARINSQPLRNVENDSTSSQREIADRRLPTGLRVTGMRSLKSIDQRLVPVVEYSSNTGRSSDRIVDVNQNETLVSNFKFDGLVNVIQVILGVYLIGQIFAHSSKKIPFGYHRLLPSLSSIKDKLE